MEKSIVILYLQIAGRFDKIIWTHKIQEKEGDINDRDNKSIKNWKCALSALTSGGAIGTIFSWSGEICISITTAIISAISTFLIWRFPDGEIINKSQANKAYAAKMRNMRNCYESLLTDILACNLSIEEILRRRNILEEEENKLFEVVAPNTSSKAITLAKDAINQKQESTTTLIELNSHLPKHLQLSEKVIKDAISDYAEN
jgi:low affinity Fe/Cu permease